MQPDIDAEQAHQILKRHCADDGEIQQLTKVERPGTSVYSHHATVYIVRSPTRSYVLKLKAKASEDPAAAAPQPSPSPSASVPVIVGGNDLATEEALLKLVASKLPPGSPVPTVHAYDGSLSLVPYPYLLLSYPHSTHARSLADARASMSDRQKAMADLRVGQLLRSLHAIDNEWFGTPSPGAEDEKLSSWQEAFTLALEETLCALESMKGPYAGKVPFGEIRQYLSRAISFFLFDDCEWPRLISFSAGYESVLVETDSSDDSVQISSFLVYGLPHAIWGDPLMENLFQAPNDALKEGYGEPLIVFPRQRTKRMWYTLLTALIALAQEEAEESERATWAVTNILLIVGRLKNAPCN